MDASDITKDFKELTSKRENLVFMARTAESAERYEDMCKVMKLLVEWNDGKTPLDIEERNLLSVAYKNVIGTRRASHRCLSAEEYKDNKWISEYKALIEKELDEICQEILSLLTKTLIPGTQDLLKTAKGSKADSAEIVKIQEAQVFYLKMTGDYYRYLAEIIKSNEDFVVNAKDTYTKAMDIAKESLLPTHPIRLGLALNFSVCYYEILKDHAKACDLAKNAFDAAIAKLDSIDEGSYKDSTLIMQLLRDNLTLWTSPDQSADAGGDPDE
mmetsp:Transcript_1051/g.2350  ORF Transcript_1051/g.2350 Transcript_1051/m.2350 type:complete len:271 (+) Transcript_1051:95-907(+)|eukprot:CAMPEP_0114486452 /NCGR_PEP_ID=MMETSP0109-20121206/221_1 /TAXON_ID=29199 /ORGANISM="Chlorarachnion reptans, Strain CCCM449" /LENGTH=270 /DNA_ID=CAMNT_0001662613 /DNA_START=81 /DNA_END=893 /DNA_ORIENTATION=+